AVPRKKSVLRPAPPTRDPAHSGTENDREAPPTRTGHATRGRDTRAASLRQTAAHSETPDAIRFACPTCGQKLKSGIEGVDRTIKCPECGVPLTVPRPGSVAMRSPARETVSAYAGVHNTLPVDTPPVRPTNRRLLWLAVAGGLLAGIVCLIWFRGGLFPSHAPVDPAPEPFELEAFTQLNLEAGRTTALTVRARRGGRTG